MEYSQTIKLDIRDHQTYEQIYTKQNDKGYPLIFEITKDKEPFDLSNTTATIQMIKPDGNIILENCTISGNTVVVTLTEQMTAVYGKCYFEISLYNGDSQRITTITGTLKVDKSVVNDGVISDSVLSIIIQSVNEAKYYYEQTKEMYDSLVTGVKGSAESSYRTGNVNITKANIGLGKVENKSSATIRSELTTTDINAALGYTPKNVSYSSSTETLIFS